MLLHYIQKFASSNDYIFFHTLFYGKFNLAVINIAIKKVLSNDLTAGMLSKDFKQRVQEFIATDKAFNFMSFVKGTLSYWKKIFASDFSYGKAIRNTNIFLNIFMW